MGSLKKNQKHLSFQEMANIEPGKKTKVFDVVSIHTLSVLGTIKWYSPWRKYWFTPLGNTGFDDNCLDVISAFCKKLKKEHRELLKTKTNLPPMREDFR